MDECLISGEDEMKAKISRKYSSNGVTVRIDAVSGVSSIRVGQRFFNTDDQANTWIAYRWGEFKKAGRNLKLMGYL